MEKLRLNLPSMYGDHHVTEVRGILTALPGVSVIAASSAWQQVELEYDAGQAAPQAIKAALLARGYSTEPSSLAPVAPRKATFTDFALAPGGFEQFPERVPVLSSPLAPCPGFEIRYPVDVHPADR